MAASGRRIHIQLAQFHAQHTLNNGQVFGWFAADALNAPVAGPVTETSPVLPTATSPMRKPLTKGKHQEAATTPPPLSPIRIALSAHRQPSFDQAAFHGVIGCWPLSAQVTLAGTPPNATTKGGATVTVHRLQDAFTGADVHCTSEHLASLRVWLHAFLQAEADMAQLHSLWVHRDPLLQAAVDNFPGMRILQQDVWECLLCFLCSSNNNIPRIRQMLSSLRRRYGHAFQGETHHEECSHSMPCISALASASETDLRALGLGYRAKFIRGTAQRLLDATWRQQAVATAQAQAEVEANTDKGIKPPRRKRSRETVAGPAEAGDTAVQGGVSAAGTHPQSPQYNCRSEEEAARAFLGALRGHPSAVVQGVLTQLPGVGRKVADCVALFSCGAADAVPVDTHVWKIAVRELDPDLGAAKSITPRIYRRVGALFRDKYGDRAGWAHSLLFAREIAK